MKSTIEVEQILEAHRHFAIDANNRAWQLAENPDASTVRDELLNLAHASAFHWQAIGTQVETMRATMLLANVHALLGLGASAQHYAQQMQTFFLAQATVPDWELAFVYTIHAHACACVGDVAGHADSYARAVSAIAAIADPEDKAIVQITFDQVPIPV